MKITAEQMEIMEYRKERLLNGAKRLEYLLSGRNRSLLPEVRTKAGKHSERRTWAFIEKLIAALEKYEKCRLCDETENDTPLEEIDYQLPEEQKQFYQSFLYCAIRVAEENPWWVLITRGYFDDILKLAERTQYYSDKYELFFKEQYKYEEIEGFFYCMDELYKAFTGKEITDTIEQTDVDEVRKRYAYEVEEIEFADKLYWEEYEQAFGGMSRQEIEEAEWESMGSAERKAAAEEAEEEKKKEQRKREWIEAFKEKKLFCEQYELCRELYFKVVVRPSDLVLKIERMIDVYMCEQEKSCFMDDKAYFYAYTLLDKTIKKVNELLKEGV